MTDSLDPIFGTLNEPQRQAVMATRGPVLILAGAGSGKTRALTHRIAYLIDQGVEPWHILAVTFTNKAAKEMQARICNLLRITGDPALVSGTWDLGSRGAKLPVTGTFHSVCARILRRDIPHIGRERSFVIYDSDDQEKLMKEVLKDLRIDESEWKPRAALGVIGRFKSEALSPREAEEQASSDRMRRVIEAYKRYQTMLFKHNALDFDDLLLETVRLFRECPDVLQRYQKTWQYLHVDEYQDTNHAQYLFVTLLAQQHQNLCVIGDPDQSIYGFRGADIRNILEFQRDYPKAVAIKLEQNYRSVQPILTAADSVIASNPNRPEKHMWTERKKGPTVTAMEVGDEGREAEETVERAVRLAGDGVQLREQVILYRTNAQSRLFEEACMKAGIPYRIIGGVKFYARREVKDVLAYLSVLQNPFDAIAMLRILNVPSRKIGDVTLGHVQAFAAEEKLTLWEALLRAGEIRALEAPVIARIKGFTNIITRFQGLKEQEVVSVLAERLLHDLNLAQWLKDGTDEGEDRWSNVEELLSVTHKYDALPPAVSLQSFLEEVTLVSEVDKLAEAGTDALTLMTLHLCKGLEFEAVTVAGCEEGLLPHSSSLFDRSQLEEERRLLYVGMTRAKTHLTLLFTRSRMLWGERRVVEPSRFLDDLPDTVDRRSDSIMSAFGWGKQPAAPLRGCGQHPGTGAADKKEPDVDLEFNQDLPAHDDLIKGSRIEHVRFGAGTVLARRGDIIDVQFDSGLKKSLALSIAKVKVL